MIQLIQQKRLSDILNDQTYGGLDYDPLLPNNTFVREKKNGRDVPNKCGRDAFAYMLRYVGMKQNRCAFTHPKELEGFLGAKLPSWLVWSGLSLWNVPRVFQSFGKTVHLDRKPCKTGFALLRHMYGATLLSSSGALWLVKDCIARKKPCAVQLSMGLKGIKNHMVFVLGYTSDGLLVLDTHEVPEFGYERVYGTNPDQYIFYISDDVFRAQWALWSKVYHLE